jgi:hypothetical protein
MLIAPAGEKRGRSRDFASETQHSPTVPLVSIEQVHATLHLSEHLRGDDTTGPLSYQNGTSSDHQEVQIR